MNSKAIVAVCVTTVALLAVVIFSLSPIVAAQTAAAVRWEYLTMQYGQSADIVTVTASNQSTRFETIFADREPYATKFVSESVGICTDFDPTCLSKNFKGLRYWLDTLGEDGWELATLANTSTQYSYQIEMIFKRQKS